MQTVQVLTLRLPASGSDGKRHVVLLTGPTTLLRYDNQNQPVHGLTARAQNWVIDGRSGMVTHLGQGRFRLDPPGTLITLDDPTADPWP